MLYHIIIICIHIFIYVLLRMVCYYIIIIFTYMYSAQDGVSGAVRATEPGQESAVQHQPAAHPGARHPETPLPLRLHHPRVRVARHHRGAHRHQQLSQRELQVPGQGLPQLRPRPPRRGPGQVDASGQQTSV